MESLAQVGVQLLLFTLGLEFSLSKLRAVRSVALLGALQDCSRNVFTLSRDVAAYGALENSFHLTGSTSLHLMRDMDQSLHTPIFSR